MRFLVMHKAVEEWPEGKPVPKVLIDGMDVLIGEAFKKGIFLNGAGLHPSLKGRTRVGMHNGALTQVSGPYAGEHELLSRLVMFKVNTKDEGLEWARRYAKAAGEVDLELGPATEQWDLGLVPKPTGPVPINFILLRMADKKTEAGTPPSEQENAVIEEMKKAGVFQASETALPSAKSRRVTFKEKKRTVVDGPFTESKELIGGFSVVELPNPEEALAWTTRYGEVLGLADHFVEVDLLQLVPPKK